MINKIEELRALAKEASIIARSKFDEPVIHLMWMTDGKIVLTLYSPSLHLNNGKNNHEYVSKSVNGLLDKIDTIINDVKSELYEKNNNS